MHVELRVGGPVPPRVRLAAGWQAGGPLGLGGRPLPRRPPRPTAQGLALPRHTPPALRRRPPLRCGNRASAGEAPEGCTLPAPEPSGGELLRFVLGVFGLYLASPVLSLADCAFVGRWSGTAELAALGPGTALCDSSAYVLSCVGVATTNLYASRRARGQLFALRRIVSDGLVIGLLAGILLGLVLALPASSLLAASSVDPSVAVPAVAYARVRALGSPLALVNMVAQAACLGERDSATPVLAVLLSGGANLLFDALLVPRHGAAGAAAATVAAQAAGTCLLLAVLRRRQRRLAECGEEGPFGVEGERPPRLFTMPGQRAWGRFLGLAGPVCVALLGKVIFMNSLTVAAAGLGTVALAAHQVAFQLWIFFCRAGDSLGAAAQAYLPAALAQRDPAPARRFILRLARFSGLWGLVNAGMACVLPLALGSLFTRDAAVQAAVSGVAPLLGLGLVLHCATLMLEGVLLASGRGQWLAKVYWFNSLVFVASLWFGSRVWSSLSFVWWAMVIFQVVRLSEFSSRVWADRWAPAA